MARGLGKRSLSPEVTPVPGDLVKRPKYDAEAEKDTTEMHVDAVASHTYDIYTGPPSSPALPGSAYDGGMTDQMDTEMLPEPPRPYVYSSSGHYGSSALSSLPVTHPLRNQVSLDALSEWTDSSAGPPTPAEEPLDYTDEDSCAPCYIYGDSSGVARPFFRLGHA